MRVFLCLCDHFNVCVFVCTSSNRNACVACKVSRGATGAMYIKAKMNELLEMLQNTKKYFVNAVI